MVSYGEAREVVSYGEAREVMSYGKTKVLSKGRGGMSLGVYIQ